jgi:spore coat protein A, manganese oxidase
MNRRHFIKLSGLAGAGLYLYGNGSAPRLLAAIPGGTLDPKKIAKFQMPLVIPPAMPRTAEQTEANGPLDYYEISVRQFNQQILPVGMPQTTVWGYGSVNHAGTHNYPAFTLRAEHKRPLRVKWVNELVDAQNRYLPHLLAVDQTLHWANPPGGTEGRDTHGMSAEPYQGPVPMTVHVHGAHTTEDSDGYAEAWFLPAAGNVPSGYATAGTWYDNFRSKFQTAHGVAWPAGASVSQYPNDQRAGTLWFHDHTLGMTRLNVYAGPAGFYLVGGGPDDLPAGVLPGPTPGLNDAVGTDYYDIPIAIQDRSFNEDGSLFYPDNRAFFENLRKDLLQIPFVPDDGCIGPSDVNPIWNPEFFGNIMVVNGRTWPFLEVEARRYRFRFLNGCNSRFLLLKFSTELDFWVIGTEGGFLPQPVKANQILLPPARRLDVVVDFTKFVPQTEIRLLNLAPDEPFGGGEPEHDFDPSDPDSTGQVMQFRVIAAKGEDKTTPPDQLVLPAIQPLGDAIRTRQVSINELDSSTVFVAHDEGRVKQDCTSEEAFGPVESMLGVLNTDKTAKPLAWADLITENPGVGDTEIWEIYNFTVDAHPIHVHQVMFQVINRQPFTGEPSNPAPDESGWLDTVIAYPRQITRIKARFDLPGLYVWHCHIVEHEDNEMMRPYFVGPLADEVKLKVRSVMPEGKLELELHAPISQVCVTEASEDFVKWTPISTNHITTSPEVIVDPQVSGVLARFYRSFIRR